MKKRKKEIKPSCNNCAVRDGCIGKGELCNDYVKDHYTHAKEIINSWPKWKQNIKI